MTCTGADVCQFIFSGNQIINENFVTTRIDHKLSDKDSLFGTYLYDKTPYSSPDAFGNVGLGTLSARQIVAVEETHSFAAAFVNAVRFGYNHERVDNDASRMRPTNSRCQRTVSRVSMTFAPAS